MRATVPKEGLMGAGFGGEVFTDMLDQQYAEIASRSQSMGLADAIASQLGADNAKITKVTAKQPEATRRAHAQKAYGQQAANQAWLAPVTGEIMTQFGPKRTMGAKHAKLHTGVDISAPEGSDIQASRGGKVTFAGSLSEHGKTVIDHGHQSSTLYGNGAVSRTGR